MSIKLYLGMPGAGKTQAMCDIVSAERKKISFHVPDRANEWSDVQSPRWRGNPPRVVMMDPDLKQGADLTTGDSDAFRNIIDYVRQEGPALFTYQNGWEDWEVAHIVHKCGDAVYCDDEIDMMANYKDWDRNPLKDFVHRGRHLPDLDGMPRQVHVMGAARRPQNLHTDLTSLSDEVMVFRCLGMNTRKRILAEGYILPEQESEMITMPNFEYFLWRNDGSIAKGVVDNPFKGMVQR